MWEIRFLFEGYPHFIIYNNSREERNQIGHDGVIFVV